MMAAYRTRVSLVLLVATAATSGSGWAAAPGFLVVDPEPDSVVFSVLEAGAATLSVRILDSDYREVLSTGPVSASEVTWDLNEAALEGVEDGIFLYEVVTRTHRGHFLSRELGRFVAAPQSRDPSRLVGRFRNVTGIPDLTADQIVLLFFDEPGDFTIAGSLGVGTDSPRRAVHLQGPNALFRMDRGRNTSAFLLTRTALGDLSDIWKSYVIGVDAEGPGDGELVVNDLGSATAGAGPRRLTITNNGDVNVDGRLCIANDCRDAWPPRIVFAPQGSSSSSLALVSTDETDVDSLVLDLFADTVDGLYGIGFDLVYPAELLMLESVVEGSFLSDSGSVSTTFLVSDENGRVIVSLTRTGAVKGRSEGSGTLLRIEFSKVDAGGDELVFEHNQAFGESGETRPAIDWWAGSFVNP